MQQPLRVRLGDRELCPFLHPVGDALSSRILLFRDIGRLVWRRKLWFLMPVFSLLVFGILLLVVLESPVLLPFFYAIF